LNFEMTEHVKINGIRLTKNYSQLTQKNIDLQNQTDSALYQTLESDRINMVFMVLNTLGDRAFVSGTIASKHFGQMIHQNGCWDDHQNVNTISIYPHHYSLPLLGFLYQMIGKQALPFMHMVSSNAMLTFVVEEKISEAFIRMLCDNFVLPESHVPFEQEENDELTQFLKKKYPETRATYVEEKIKTYGITIVPDLNLGIYDFSFDQLVSFGKKIRSLQGKGNTFFHTSAHMVSMNRIQISVLAGKPMNIHAGRDCCAELIRFHGPHFGDRHSIISRALGCLLKNDIPVLQADCTGASISILLPSGKGLAAKQALMTVFEIP